MRMVNLQSRNLIDVCQLYFDVDDGPNRKYESILGVDAAIHMNRTIAKNDAVRFIGEKKCVNSTGLEYYGVSYEKLSVDRIRDFKNRKIFNNIKGWYCGWLLQFDPTPFANWYHDCYYYFVVDYEFFKEIKYNRGLDAAIKMQELPVKVNGGFTNEKICDFTLRRN